MKKIISSFIHPPIPSRKYDWESVFEDYDEGDLIGHGETKQESIKDLKQQKNEQLL